MSENHPTPIEHSAKAVRNTISRKITRNETVGEQDCQALINVIDGILKQLERTRSELISAEDFNERLLRLLRENDIPVVLHVDD